jgi:hypothetical protein
MRWQSFSLATVLPLASATNSNPDIRFTQSKFNVDQAASNCILPGNFSLQNVVWWTPSAARNGSASPVLNFDFADKATEATTACHYNASSKPIGETPSTPRYACDNPSIEFIWESSQNLLDVIERVCPNSNG